MIKAQIILMKVKIVLFQIMSLVYHGMWPDVRESTRCLFGYGHQHYFLLTLLQFVRDL